LPRLKDMVDTLAGYVNMWYSIAGNKY